jgi:hypothetical protein
MYRLCPSLDLWNGNKYLPFDNLTGYQKGRKGNDDFCYSGIFRIKLYVHNTISI